MKFLKEYFFILIIIIFVLYINYLTDKDLNEQVSWMEDGIESVESKIAEENKEKAKDEFKELYNRWTNITEHLQLFVDHNELEKVSSDIVKIDANFKTEEDEELLENIYDLKFMLKHIEDKNKLNLKNFF